MSSYLFQGLLACPSLEKIEADIVRSSMSNQQVLYCNGAKQDGSWSCEVFFDGALSESDQEKLASIVGSAIGKQYQAPLYGHFVWEIPQAYIGRWKRHCCFVPFPDTVGAIPSEVELDSVAFDGMSNIAVEEIKETGFVVSATSVGKDNNWGTTSVEFDWRVVE